LKSDMNFIIIIKQIICIHIITVKSRSTLVDDTCRYSMSTMKLLKPHLVYVKIEHGIWLAIHK